MRGRQSAAVLIVPAAGEPWRTTVSLRVEDHPVPLLELRRLFALHGAYELAGRGDELVNDGRHDEAAALFAQASGLAPDNDELLFWSGLGAVDAGHVEAGLERVRAAIALHPPWRDVLARLPAAVAPSAAAVLSRL